MVEICRLSVEIDVLEGHILDFVFFIVVFYEGRAQEVWVSREMDVVENDSTDAVTGSAVVFFAEDDMNPEESCFIDVLYPYVFEQYVREVVLVATGLSLIHI